MYMKSFTIVAMRGRDPDNPSERGKSNGKYRQRIEPNNGGMANTITSVQKDNLLLEYIAQPIKRERTKEEKLRRHLHGDKGAKFSSRQMVAGVSGIMGAITTVTDKDNLIMETQTQNKASGAYGFYEMTPSEEALRNKPKGKGWKYVMAEKGPAWVRLRKLTPRSCFRLMDVDEDKIDKLLNAGISDSRLYQLAGNSIVVACMEGIFYNLFCEEEIETAQLTLF